MRPRPLTSPAPRILLATPAASGRRHRVKRAVPSGSQELVATSLAIVAAGGFITFCELLAFRWWYRSAWQAALATVAIAPRGLLTFAAVNVAIGAFAILLYRQIEQHTESALRATGATAITTTLIFWVTPTIAIAAMGLLPTPLLLAAPMLGVIAGGGGTVLGASLYRRLARTSH